MTILGLIVVICLLGLLGWAVTTCIPMPQPFKNLIIVVLVVVAVLITLNAFGLLGNLNVNVPRLH